VGLPSETNTCNRIRLFLSSIKLWYALAYSRKKNGYGLAALTYTTCSTHNDAHAPDQLSHSSHVLIQD
jgi:hypothetical protein